MTEAERAAKALERQRAKIHGAGATLTLYDKAGASLVVVSRSFFVANRTNLALGEEYHEAEVSELAGMTQAVAKKADTAQLSTMASKMSVTKVEDPTTAARTWLLRLTPFKKQ